MEGMLCACSVFVTWPWESRKNDPETPFGVDGAPHTWHTKIYTRCNPLLEVDRSYGVVSLSQIKYNKQIR